MEIRWILCPVDFSETSEHALDYAIDFAHRLGARLELVHAYQLPTYGMPDGVIFEGADFASRLDEELDKQLDTFVQRCRSRGVEARGYLVRGTAHREIVRRAKESEVDLIVMGTHGRTGLEHVLLGSVAERVVRTAPMPVLTVRWHT